MKKATAKRSFKRPDTREVVRAGDRIIASDSYIDELERNGLVRNVIALPGAPENKAEAPTRVAGRPSSALPVDQASTEQTAIESDYGVKKRVKKIAESSSSTPVTE